MKNRADLRSTPEYKTWVRKKKKFDAIVLPILIIAITLLVCYDLFWLTIVDVDIVIFAFLLLTAGAIYFAYSLLAPYHIGEFTFKSKLIYPYKADASPELKVRDSSGKLYSAEDCVWCRLPVDVPILLIHRAGKIYDFLYIDDFYNRFSMPYAENSTYNMQINFSLDGVNWEKSTINIFSKMLSSVSFREKVLEDYNANPDLYK